MLGRDGEPGSAGFIDLLECRQDPPTGSLDREERDRMVQQAVNAISPTLRETLLLAYFQRLTYAQIADELGVPLGTVKSRLHAAVAAFAKRWIEITRDDREGPHA